MGAWGVQAFDNDDANDWAFELAEADDLSVVESALNTVTEAKDYLESPDASNALAACEVLARLNGKPGYKNSYTEDVDEWVATHPQTPSPALVASANASINRILGDNFELKELCADTDEYSNWLASVDDLRKRLRR